MSSAFACRSPKVTAFWLLAAATLVTLLPGRGADAALAAAPWPSGSTDLAEQLSWQAPSEGVAPTEASGNRTAVSTPPLVVPLQKQYVPILKGSKITGYKTAYFGKINLGSPAVQPFTAVFDTGSGHVILPSSTCTSEACSKHRRFDRAASSSAVEIEHDGTVLPADAVERDEVTIAFGSGEVLGQFVNEVVCLDLEQPTYKRAPDGRPGFTRGDAEALGDGCVGLRVVVAVEMTEDPFGLFQFDGILGLGLSALTIDPHFSFFSQLAQQHAGMQPQFAVFLAEHDGGESVISFGGYDPSRGTSALNWSPVARPELGYWQVQLKGVRVGDTVLEECADGSCYAALDTGSSMLGVPRGLTRKMHRALARPVLEKDLVAGGEIDCRSIPGKEIHFDLGSHVVSLGAVDYSRPSPFNLTTAGASDAWRLYCRSLLLPVDMEEPLGNKVFIWGEPVLRRYYTVYDIEKQQVGFSRARASSGGASGLPVVGAPPQGSHVSGVGLPAGLNANADARPVSVA